MTSFAVRLQQFADKTNRNSDTLVRGVVTDIATKLVERSPVGDPSLWQHPAPKGYEPGTFRGNWQVGIGSIPSGETGRIDPGGSETLDAMIGAIGEHPAGTVVYISNNVPYARPIEDGHSTQAPAGLVGLTAVEFQQVVDARATALAA
jgi:hypothetical protein